MRIHTIGLNAQPANENGDYSKVETFSVARPMPVPTLESIKATAERIARKCGPPLPPIVVSRWVPPDGVYPMPDMILVGVRAAEKLLR